MPKAIVAGSTPSPQSLRDSSPQAGEQFKSTPLGCVFKAQKGQKGNKGQKAVVLKAIVAGSTPSPQSLRDSSPIIMVFASKLIENRFVKFISFDDGEHSCYNFGS